MTAGKGNRGTERKRRWPWAVLGLCVILAGLAMGIGSWLHTLYKPPVATTVTRVVVQVGPGSSADDVALALQRAHLIRSPFAFRLYLRVHHSAKLLQTGKYAVVRGTTIPDIVHKLTSGDVVREHVAVTIPEGFTLVQIANRLDKAGVCPKSAFLKEQEQGLFHEPFFSQLPRNPDIKYRLEGYLFPDTYQFIPNQSAHEVIDAMLRNFQHHLDRIGAMQTLQEQARTVPDLVTKASLVEGEAEIERDRPLIASVIDNRLQRHMKLQIDATILYVLGHRDIVTDKDLKVKDPYNTYLHRGLPPGPIVSPGLASIQAALHPAHTKYLYYVARYDGSGGSYFSSTESQHLKNIRRSEANLRSIG